MHLSHGSLHGLILASDEDAEAVLQPYTVRRVHRRGRANHENVSISGGRDPGHLKAVERGIDEGEEGPANPIGQFCDSWYRIYFVGT